MAEILGVFFLLGLVILLGYIAEKLFKKTNIPDVLFLILVGVIFSSILKLVRPAAVSAGAPVFTMFALIFICFEGALNMNLKRVITDIPQAMKISIAGFISSIAVVLLVGLLIGLQWQLSILLGAILGGISGVVVIPLVKKLSISKKAFSTLILESAISDVFCIIGVATIAQVFRIGSLNPANLLSSLLVSFVVAIFVGLAFGLIWIRFLQRTTLRHPYMITIAILLIVYSATEYVNSSGAIACIVFGLVLGNARQSFAMLHKTTEGEVLTSSAKGFYSQINFLVKTLAFVYLGILIDFSQMLSLIWALLIVAALFLIRPLVVRLTAPRDLSRHDILMMEALVPKGLAASILAWVPLQYGIPGAATLPTIVVSVVFFSITLSSILIFLASRNKFHGIYPFIKKGISKKIRY